MGHNVHQMDTKVNKDGLTEVVKVRVPRQIAKRFQRIATLRVKRTSELAREAFVRFIEAEEAELATKQR